MARHPPLYGPNLCRYSRSSDQVQIENSILLPSLWEGLGEGRSYGKEKSKLPVCAGLQPAQDLFWVADS
jgi:hypothetical protein